MMGKEKDDVKKRFDIFLRKYANKYKGFHLKIDSKKANFYAERIEKALENDDAILIVGDYDPDGICSTAYKIETIKLLAKALKLDEPKIDTYIPSRAEHYGIKYEYFRYQMENYGLIITSDNGTHSSFYEKLTDKDHEKLLIVDHHPFIDPDMPVSDEEKEKRLKEIKKIQSRENVINPNTDGSVKISTGILDEWLFVYMRKKYPELEKITEPDELSDLAMITLLSDMADTNNSIVRGIIKKGLKKASKRERAIYQYLFPTFDGIADRDITVEDISFLLAPLLNSGTRMTIGDVSWIPELMIQKKKDKIFEDSMDMFIYTNELRKEATNYYAKIAEEKAKEQLDNNKELNLCVVKINECPIGINGLIAGNLSQKFGIPVIMVSQNVFGENPEELLGSGRGEGVKQLISKLHSTSAEAKESVNFGGHNMAVGVQISEWDKFENELNAFNKKPFTDIKLSEHLVFNKDPISIKEYKLVSEAYKNITDGVPFYDQILVKIKGMIVGYKEYRNDFTKLIVSDNAKDKSSYTEIIARVPSEIDIDSLQEIEFAIAITPFDNSPFADIVSDKNIRPNKELLMEIEDHQTNSPKI